jgi:tetratricopeptide (TPR) repeat protein
MMRLLRSGAARGRKLAEALELYTKAHEVDPHNVPVLTNRAAVYMALGKNDKAVCDCELAIATGKIVMAEAKIVARAYERKGKAEVLLGKYGEAASSFEGALELGGAVEELLEDAKVKVEEERREKEEKRKQEEDVAVERASAQRKAEEEQVESIAAEHRAEEERVAVERKRKEEERVAIEEMKKAEEERIAVEKKNEEELKKRVVLEGKKKKEEEEKEEEEKKKKKKAGEERIAVEKNKALDMRKAEEDKSAEESTMGSKPSKGESNGSTKDPVMQEIATPVCKPLEMTTLQV